MATQKLTYRFYSFKTGEEGTIRTYKTFFPFVTDATYHLPASMTYEYAFNYLTIYKGKTVEEAQDLLNNENGYFRPDQTDIIKDFIFNFFSPNMNEWNPTIAVTYSGQDPFIKTDFSNAFNFSTGYDDNGNFFGQMKLDTSDTPGQGYGEIVEGAIVEIVLKDATIGTPWVYYGTSRYDLATKFGREPTGMGGMHPSVVPAEAMSMTYRMDGDIVPTFGVPMIIPFPSAFFIASFSNFAVDFKTIVMAWEILDGRLDYDGSPKIAIRSSTAFTVYSLGIGPTLGPLSVVLSQTDWNAESYRNVHSKTLEYQDNTYKEKEIIENTTFVFLCETKVILNNFYKKLSQSFDKTLSKFINYKTCKFKVYTFESGELTFSSKVGETKYQTETISKETISGEMSSFFKSVENLGNNTEKQYTPSLKDSFISIEEISRSIFWIDMATFLAAEKAEEEEEVEEGEEPQQTNTLPDPRLTSYSFIYLSNMDFEFITVSPEEEGGEPLVYSPDLEESQKYHDKLPTQLEVTVEDIVYVNPRFYVSCGLIIPNGKQSLSIESPVNGLSFNYKDYYMDQAAYVFTDSFTFALEEYLGFKCFVFDFLDTFYLSIGKSSFDVEEDYFEEEETVDANTILSQCEAVMEPIDYVDQDYNKDGVLNVMDRIYSLYRDTVKYGGSDNGPEIRYWRHVCPIGQPFRVRGTIERVNTYMGDVYFNFHIGGDVENKILVYMERGAKTNISAANPEDEFEIQGILYYPPYFMGVRYDSFMDFTTAEGAYEWYRLRKATLNFIYEVLPRTVTLSNKPLIIIRSNIILEPGDSGSPGSDVPPIFAGSYDDSVYEFGASIVQIQEKVEDYLYDLTSAQDPTGTDGIRLAQGESLVLIDLGSGELTFHDLKFEMEVTDNVGQYEYEVVFNKEGGNENGYQLWKFHSELAKENSSVNIQLSGIFKFVCEEGEEEDQKTFYIKHSYSKKRQPGFLGDQEVSYDFKWENDKFAVYSVTINGQEIVHKLNDEENGSALCTVFPKDGKVIFENTINSESQLVEVLLVNVSDNTQEEIDAEKFSPTKNGNYLALRRIDNITTENNTSPLIKSVKLNAGRRNNVERVEGYFSHSSRSAKHYMCPTYGFVYFSGEGTWYMTPDDGRDLAGDIASPYFYIDRYGVGGSNASANIVDKTSENLVSLDRIYGNISSRAQPFVTTQSIYSPPDITVEQLLKTSSYYSNIMTKMSLVYNFGPYLNQRISFVDFQSRTDPKIQNSEGVTVRRDNLRISLPICSTKTTFVEEPLFTSVGDAEFADFQVDSKAGILVGLNVISMAHNTDDVFLSEPFELYATIGGSEMLPFGYSDSGGTNTAKRFAAFGRKGEKNVYAQDAVRSYVRLPNTTNVGTIRIKKPNNSNVGNILEVKGEYVDDLIQGQSPQVFEVSTGTYFLFYVNKDGNANLDSKKIMLVATRDDGYRWNRPFVGRESLRYGEPIPVYTSSSGVSNLVGLKDFNTEYSVLFFYDYSDKAIKSIMFPQALASRIYIGIGEEESQTEGDEEKGIGERDPFITDSWENYFKSGNNIRTVLNGPTDIFSISSIPAGITFLAAVTDDSTLRMYHNRRIRNAKEDEGTDWEDIGVNLLHEDSFLYKALDGKTVSSVNLAYGTHIDDIMRILISTSDNNLFMLDIPPMALYSNISETEQVILNRNQELINREVPVLIMGDLADFSEEAKTSFISDGAFFGEFLPQIISIEWSVRGNCLLFYYDKDKKLKCIKSDNMRHWREYKNV